ncbi:heat shock protein 9/12-domain-containing protein [Ganoderma leucocontextum]|nr:heat shock protein 9/12-domain-containing protein [Ganoderma leucocontextum]
MSDTGRQSFTDKAQSSMKPDSQKSTTEQVADKAKGAYDSVASTAQPQSEKSTGQKAGDTVSGNSNKDSQSMTDKAKNAMSMNQ